MDIADIERSDAGGLQFQKILDSLPHGIQIIDHAWRYIYVNNAVALHGNTSIDELIGKTMMQVYPGIELTEFFSILEQCMKERKGRDIENEFIYPDKSKRWFKLKIEEINEGILIQSTDITELRIANQELIFQNLEKEKRAAELTIANNELAFQNEEKGKRATELIRANKELAFQNKEKGKRADELTIANRELAFQNEEKEKRANELIIANRELAFQNEEKGKRAEELIIANKELEFQNQEKEKRAGELIIANKELAFQNHEKEKRANELVIANKELAFQNEEKGKRAEELIIANKELEFQNQEKEKRAEELIIANMELAFQNREKEKRADELIIANKELAFQNEERKKRAEELIIATIQKDEAEKYHSIIEEKNKNITDSINYAKLIQQAKLPQKRQIYSALSDAFILFKPKDIVSGDFYFFYKNSRSLFIAAADCTGHGVPGAFMSMIGSEKLTAAVCETVDTSQILKNLNKGMKDSLQQSGNNESSKDGMDIALCSIDTENRQIEYAGANRPLWLIRKGQNVIEEFKGTNRGIGGTTDNDQEYKSYDIQLQQGDTFYMFSDGYASTFGGADGKKLKTKIFKEILLEIQELSMRAQEEYLDAFIENWKDGTEQIDDILVIGVRL